MYGKLSKEEEILALEIGKKFIDNVEGQSTDFIKHVLNELVISFEDSKDDYKGVTCDSCKHQKNLYCVKYGVHFKNGFEMIHLAKKHKCKRTR